MISPTVFVIIITIVLAAAIYLITKKPEAWANTYAAQPGPIELTTSRKKVRYQTRAEYKFGLNPGCPYLTMKGYPEYN